MSVAVWVVILLAIFAAQAYVVLDNEKRANRGPGHQSTLPPNKPNTWNAPEGRN